MLAPMPVTRESSLAPLEAPDGHSNKETKRSHQQHGKEDEEPCIVSDDELISLILKADGGAQCAYCHAINHARRGRNVNSDTTDMFTPSDYVVFKHQSGYK